MHEACAAACKQCSFFSVLYSSSQQRTESSTDHQSSRQQQQQQQHTPGQVTAFLTVRNKGSNVVKENMKHFIVMISTLAVASVSLLTKFSVLDVVSAYSSSSAGSGSPGSGPGGRAAGQGSGDSGGGSSRRLHTPFIRKQDIYGIWRLTHQNMNFPKAPIKTTRSSSSSSASASTSSTIRYPMKEFTVYPKDQKSNHYRHHHNQFVATEEQEPLATNDDQGEIVIRLNEDGSYTPTTDETGSGITGRDQNSSSNDLQRVLGRGGAWEYREQDGKIILAPGRPVDADGRKVHDTLLTGQLDVHISECLPSDFDQSVQLPDDNVVVDKQHQDEQLMQNLELSSSSPESSSTTDNDNVAGFKSTDDRAGMSDPTMASPSHLKSVNKKTPDVDVHLSIPHGNVSIGKFMYPRTHKAFFDDPILFSESSIGTFSMKQLLGNLNARLRQGVDDDGHDEVLEEQRRIARKKYHKRDFYGRKFYLTATPHPINPQYAAEDKHFDEKTHKTRLTVMPIEFFSNNTFTAHGAEKILRGRYGTTGENGDRLWLQVTLFGFGRKKGHVYSEGRLLSHDDRRGYLGRIIEYPTHKELDQSCGEVDGRDSKSDDVKKEDAASTSDLTDHVTNNDNSHNRTKFFVEGDFYYGGWQAGRANSFGTFTLQEIDNEVDGMDDEEEDEEDRRQQEFIDRLENLMTDNQRVDDDSFQ